MYCKLYLFLILVIIIKEKKLNIHKLNQPLHILHYGLPWRRSEETACSAEAPGPVPGSARSPGEGNGSPVLLPGKAYEHRSLVGYSRWGTKCGT